MGKSRNDGGTSGIWRRGQKREGIKRVAQKKEVDVTGPVPKLRAEGGAAYVRLGGAPACRGKKLDDKDDDDDRSTGATAQIPQPKGVLPPQDTFLPRSNIEIGIYVKSQQLPHFHPACLITNPIDI